MGVFELFGGHKPEEEKKRGEGRDDVNVWVDGISGKGGTEATPDATVLPDEEPIDEVKNNEVWKEIADRGTLVEEKPSDHTYTADSTVYQVGKVAIESEKRKPLAPELVLPDSELDADDEQGPEDERLAA